MLNVLQAGRRWTSGPVVPAPCWTGVLGGSFAGRYLGSQKKDNTYTQSNIKDHTNKAELTTTTANGHTTNQIKDPTTSTAKDMET